MDVLQHRPDVEAGLPRPWFPLPALRDALLGNFFRAAASEQSASADWIGWVEDALASEVAVLALDSSHFCEDWIVVRWRDTLVEAALRFSGLALDIEGRVQRAFVARLGGRVRRQTRLLFGPPCAGERRGGGGGERAEALAVTACGAMRGNAPKELCVSSFTVGAQRRDTAGHLEAAFSVVRRVAMSGRILSCMTSWRTSHPLR